MVKSCWNFPPQKDMHFGLPNDGEEEEDNDRGK